MWAAPTRMALLRSTLVIVAASLANSSPADPERMSAWDLHREIVSKIEQEQSLNPRSERLIGPLTSIARLHQESGDYVPAAAAIERAVQLVRVNFGLHSLDQAPLLRLWIANEEARGNLAAAWDFEQELLALVRRHPDDLRTVPILREVAARRIDVLNRYLNGEYPPQITACLYDESHEKGESCTNWGRLDVITTVLSAAMEFYASAIAVLLRNEQYSSAELRELETELVRSLDLPRYRRLIGRRTSARYLPSTADVLAETWQNRVDAVIQLAGWDIPYWYDGTRLEAAELREREIDAARRHFLRGQGYSLGRLSLRRLLAYEIAASSPQRDRIAALVRLADWDLLHSRSRSRTESAVEMYEEAYALAHEHGVAQAWIDETFSLETPIMLPTFWPNPLAAEQPSESTKSIDIAFDVSKHGRSRRIEVIKTTGDVSRSEQRAVVRLIKRSRFRPRVTGGTVTDAAVVARHFFP